MKRAIGFLLILIAFVTGFLSLRGTMPFMPIMGTSMEPILHAGSLLLIEPIDPRDIKEGDIIVFSVPEMVREIYNYPALVAHRVITVRTDGMVRFRTKGDNTGEDPFTVRPQDVRGKVGKQIPYIGFSLLFLQSKQGLIFLIIALALLALFLYGTEISTGGSKLQRGIFSPVIRESYRTNRVLVQKIDSTEKRMDKTQDALEKFASAIALYAQHLSSHTSAIQGLSEASHELKRSAAEQNRVIADLLVKGTAGPLLRVEPRTEEVVARATEPPPVERTIVSTRKQPEADQVTVAVKAVPRVEQVVAKGRTQPAAEIAEPKLPQVVELPPGCLIKRRALMKRAHELAQKPD